jgi:sugar transferase (PEP-CTERM/EpsH1 system associated)
MKILFIQNRILFPTNTGGRIRTLNILRHLAKWHDVTYLANLEPGEQQHCDPMRKLGLQLETVPWQGTSRDDWKFYRDLALNFFSSMPFSVAKDNNPALRARAEQLVARDNYDLVICDFVQMAPAAVGLSCRASLLFQHNVEAQIFERHARTDRGWLRRWVMSRQWRKMQRFENRAGKQFDAVIAVSDQDREIFTRQYGWKHVRVIDTAVDVDYFQPQGEGNQGDVAFVGSMDWMPNQEGVAYFVEEIWPQVRVQHPRARFRIVGRNPSPQVESLAGREGVEVLGTVPDVRPYLDEATVVVTPLLVGGGTRIKIFEAMAMEKPVVSTSLAAEGLKVIDQQHILLADTADRFATAVGRLLENSDERQRIGRAARELVCEKFAAEPVARQFDAICLQAVEEAKQ